MSNKFNFDRSNSIKVLEIEGKEYTLNLDELYDEKDQKYKKVEALGKSLIEFPTGENVLKSGTEIIDLLLGEGSTEEIFKDMPKVPVYIVQVVEFIQQYLLYNNGETN